MSITITGTPKTSLVAQMASGNLDNFSCKLTSSSDASVEIEGLLSTTYYDPSLNGNKVSYIFLINPLISVTIDTLTIYKNDESVMAFTYTPSIEYKRGRHDVIVNFPRTPSTLNEITVSGYSSLDDLLSGSYT